MTEPSECQAGRTSGVDVAGAYCTMVVPDEVSLDRIVKVIMSASKTLPGMVAKRRQNLLGIDVRSRCGLATIDTGCGDPTDGYPVSLRVGVVRDARGVRRCNLTVWVDTEADSDDDRLPIQRHELYQRFIYPLMEHLMEDCSLEAIPSQIPEVPTRPSFRDWLANPEA